VQCQPRKGFRIYSSHDSKETIIWWPCTPPWNLDTFSKKSALQLFPVRREEEYDDDGDTSMVKSRMSDFSRRELKARVKSLGISVARYGPVDYC
jgi:hypothetical protein